MQKGIAIHIIQLLTVDMENKATQNKLNQLHIQNVHFIYVIKTEVTQMD